MNHENISDFEINKRVAESLGFTVTNEQINEVVGEMWVIKNNKGARDGLPDYFNNPSDAWPIIVESKISLIEEGDEWAAYFVFELPENMEGGGCDFIHGWTDKNPLRAAMIVYLMMQEAKC
ncbi:protein ninX [Alteromonas phage PB15]|nr:protein ninX [Alteromonas phage PB15]